MDNPLILPRLRLTRHSPRMKADNSATPIAGPSRILHDDYLTVPDDEDDSQSTPRISTLTKLASSEKNSPINATSPPLVEVTPAERLRALLARSSTTPSAPTRQPRPPSPSDVESDFEPVNPAPNTPSFAQKSLKDLFSRALRDPGGTPLRSRRRRNSVDASPGVDRTVEQERAYNRGKRASMSDEEADKISQIARREGSSVPAMRSAAAFIAMRERQALSDASSSKPPTPPPEQVDASSSESEEPMDISEDTTTVLKHMNGDSSIPPIASSTPLRSMQIPLQNESQSNLLEQDSEMQRAMRDLDSFEESQSLQSRKMVFPPVRDQMTHRASPTRPLSWSSHSKSHTTHNLPLSRRTSEEFDSSSSRASSIVSNAEFQERRTEAEQERLIERERAWRVPSKVPTTPGTPERPRHQHSHSSPSHSFNTKPDTPAYSRSRRVSNASITSIDDGSSSRASSVSSHAEHRARMKEMEEEKNKERERLWNMPAHSRTRASSSLGMHSPRDRVRTYSTPSRPDSAQGYLSPVHSHSHSHGLHRKQSITSLSGSSRASSPAHSPVHSVEFGEQEVVQHIRERNWNSPHPKWKPSPNRRSVSPMPHTPPPDASTSDVKIVNGSNGSISHSRTSLRTRKSIDVLLSTSSTRPSPPKDKGKARDDSHMVTHSSPSFAKPSASSSRHTPSDASHTRPSPQPPPPAPESEAAPVPPSSPSKIPNFKSRFGWQFPHNRAPLPPLDVEKDPPPHPELRPTSPVRPLIYSRIPTASAHHSHVHQANGDPIHTEPPKASSPGSPPENGQAAIHRKKGHRRSPTELHQAVGRIPPRIHVTGDEGEVDLEPIPIVEKDGSERNSSPSLSTPLAKPTALPPLEPRPSTPPPAVLVNGDTFTTIALSARDSTPPSPPESIPSFLQTPPRKTSPHTSKLEFKTPSPPRNMPALPGPPSSSENDEDDDDRTPVNRSADLLGNFSSMKTPRPPGAWAATPAHIASERDLIVRPNSTPPIRTPSPLASTPAPGIRAATMSRAGSLPSQTPAPPGAWLVTPAAAANSARRKSLLKVRFDVDPGELSSDVSMLESTPPPAKAKVAPPPMPKDVAAIPTIVAPVSGSTSESGTAESGTEDARKDRVPENTERTKRETGKSAFVRLLDAFGRETSPATESPSPPSESPVEQRAQQKQGIKLEVSIPRPPDTPRSRSAIRILDALGREVQDVEDVKPEEPEPFDTTVVPRGRHQIAYNPHYESDGDNDDFGRLSHNEALERVRRTIKDLAIDLDEVDRSYDDLALDSSRLSALEDASRAARNARKRISSSLQYVQSAEEDLKRKFISLRKGMHESKLLPGAPQSPVTNWGRINTWTVCTFLFIQLVLMVLMYRYSSVQARRMFLTTYYDAFNSDLYLHLSRPDTLRRAISIPSASSFTSSLSSMVKTLPQVASHLGWPGAVTELWGNVTSLVVEWAMPLPEANAPWESWPPT